MPATSGAIASTITATTTSTTVTMVWIMLLRNASSRPHGHPGQVGHDIARPAPAVAFAQFTLQVTGGHESELQRARIAISPAIPLHHGSPTAWPRVRDHRVRIASVLPVEDEATARRLCAVRPSATFPAVSSAWTRRNSNRPTRQESLPTCPLPPASTRAIVIAQIGRASCRERVTVAGVAVQRQRKEHVDDSCK